MLALESNFISRTTGINGSDDSFAAEEKDKVRFK